MKLKELLEGLNVASLPSDEKGLLVAMQTAQRRRDLNLVKAIGAKLMALDGKKWNPTTLAAQAKTNNARASSGTVE